MIEEKWIREWFEKIKKEKGEYVSGNTLDGNFPLNELTNYLNEKLKKNKKKIMGELSLNLAAYCYELMDQTWLLQSKQAFERDLENSIDHEDGVFFASARIQIIDSILEEREGCSK